MKKTNGTESFGATLDGCAKMEWTLADAFAIAETIRKYEGGDPSVQEIYDAMMEYNFEEAQLRNGEGHA